MTIYGWYSDEAFKTNKIDQINLEYKSYNNDTETYNQEKIKEIGSIVSENTSMVDQNILNQEDDEIKKMMNENIEDENELSNYLDLELDSEKKMENIVKEDKIEKSVSIDLNRSELNKTSFKDISSNSIVSDQMDNIYTNSENAESVQMKIEPLYEEFEPQQKNVTKTIEDPTILHNSKFIETLSNDVTEIVKINLENMVKKI